MINYRKSFIYKIQHKENKFLCYIGSTCNLRARRNRHKSHCTNVNSPHHNYKLYTMIRSNGGWDAFNMIVVEEVDCETKQQLCIREEKTINEYNPTMNTIKAYRSVEEEVERSKLRNIKIPCECGCLVSKKNISIHIKSKKHQNLMDNM